MVRGAWRLHGRGTPLFRNYAIDNDSTTMNNCREFELDDLMAVTAIPVADIPAGDPASPANCLAPTIDAEGFSPVLTHAIVIGMQPATAGGILIPIRRRTGKAKDDESDSVSGRLHTVSVTCEVDDRDGSVWSPLLTLERTPRHLLLTFRGGTQAFVAATEDTYLCNVERDGAKTTVTFRIQDIMGIQLLA